MPLAALLAQLHPQPAVLREHVLDCHPERRANAGERIDHEADQRAVAQAGVCRDIDTVEQRARFGRIEHRRLPAGDDMPGPAHRVRRVDLHHVTGDQPIEQVAERGEPQLDGRRRQFARPGLDLAGDVHRLHGRDRRHAGACAPGQKFLGGAGIGPAGVRIANVGREEFEEAHRGA